MHQRKDGQSGIVHFHRWNYVSIYIISVNETAVVFHFFNSFNFFTLDASFCVVVVCFSPPFSRSDDGRVRWGRVLVTLDSSSMVGGKDFRKRGEYVRISFQKKIEIGTVYVLLFVILPILDFPMGFRFPSHLFWEEEKGKEGGKFCGIKVLGRGRGVWWV